MKNEYKSGSLSLLGAIAMGTGVMIGAGIFALTGQVAELAGALFPFAFLAAAIISGFSAYSYIKMSNAYPSAGGIAMYLKKAYGRSTMTGVCALLMAFSMIINESLVGRTFGTYTLQLFNVGENSYWVPILAVGLIAVAFLINISGNKIIGSLSQVTAFLKIGGIIVFAAVTLWAAGFSFKPDFGAGSSEVIPGSGFMAGVAIAILAYKGFTTITNSGGEVKNPEKNVGRAIIASLAICVVVYLLVAFAVASSLPLAQIVEAKNFALAEAAKPALGQYGVWFTVAIAIIATASGIIASVFAVSRMLAMLSEMEIIPHRHFGMPGDIQKHTLVYTVVLAAALAAFFDLTRIASLGAIFYLLVDIAIHWGVFRNQKNDINVNGAIVMTALVLDIIVLGAMTILKGSSDPMLLVIAAIGLLLTFLGERFFLKNHQMARE
ncbi:APC family permease [Myxosarcina sp. GI1]|uniref:APC family permease n=1 Tax=Myxosarcina sp. GI1 TaxID=1541065 RepID=UPI000563E0BC|nr:APC family permease [Myxosarcina sp. GI1]